MQRVKCVAISSDAKWVAAGDYANVARIYDARDGAMVGEGLAEVIDTLVPQEYTRPSLSSLEEEA